MIETWVEGEKVDSDSQEKEEGLAETVSSGRNEISGDRIVGRAGGRSGSWGRETGSTVGTIKYNLFFIASERVH